MKFRFNHVLVILPIALLYVAVGPLLPFFDEFSLETTALVTLLIALISFIRGPWARFDFWFSLIVMIGLLSVRFLYAETNEPPVLLLRTAAWSSLILLNAALLIGPWSRFSTKVLHWYKHRRHIGVTAFLMGSLHAHTVLKTYFSYDLGAAYEQPFIAFGGIALMIMSILAATSWDYVQKHVTPGMWKIIHSALFVVFLTYLSYIWSRTGNALVTWQKIFIAGFIGYWILVAPWSVVRALFTKINGWKQLHVLIYIAYAAVMIHVSTGALVAKSLPVKIFFWSLFIFVLASHIVGWIAKIRFDRSIPKCNQKMEIEGKPFIRLDDEKFHEGKGRLFNVLGELRAVFLHEGKLFALDNRCPHQGGPIYRACIRKGYVECPWHRYQFGVKDGKGPPGFPDKIAYYEVVTRDGAAYVAQKSSYS